MLCPFRHVLVQEELPSKVVYTLCSKDKLYEKIFSKHLRRQWLFHGHCILLDKLGLVLGYGFCIRVQVYKVVA